MGDTPKKIVQSVKLCFICSKEVDKKENKMRIFGTRSADIIETIRLALEVDLKCYSCSQYRSIYMQGQLLQPHNEVQTQSR